MESRLEELARSPVLLVGSDYDGTLSPIVDDPALATPDREAMVALRALAEMPQTHVVVVSGRSLRDLAELTGEPRHVHLVGSHGSEFDQDFVRTLTEDQVNLRERLTRSLEEIAAGHNGLAVETKPASSVLHYRNAPEHAAEAALEAVFDGPASMEGVHARRGKKVVELAVLETNKGEALATVRRRVGATAAVFFGDDLTDEDAFSSLAGPDVGVKVGPGETCARHRVEDTGDVARLLAQLAEMRSAWLAGSHAEPIESLAMLSDQRTAALETRSARLVWFCAPRVDSAALFAELLGGPTAGYFDVSPADDESRAPTRQEYLDNALVLRSTWPDFDVTDYLDVSSGLHMRRAGRSDLVRVIEGRGRVAIEFAPRLEFGRVPTRLRVVEDGLEIEDTPDFVVLRSPGVEWELRDEGPHQTARAVVELGRDPCVLELRYGTGAVEASIVPETERRRQTRRFWSDWAEGLSVPGARGDLLRHSALVLRGLVYGPTGAIAAAATTSLPEHLGGVRNWDYRYCWPRDAAMSAHALLRLGSSAEAMRFLDWCLGIVDRLESPSRFSPVYTVSGSDLGPESEISELSGYSGSRPVRVGNLASRQIQLDVFGPIAELMRELMRTGAPMSSEHWRLVEAMVVAVEERWSEPDHGIWEVRLPRRHHVHSKTMCWVTVDRAARMARRFLGRERPAWVELRDRIAEDVREHGWNERAGAYTTAYGSDDLDASVLHIGLCGLLRPDDERFVSTVERVREELLSGPVVYRYRLDDGLPGQEGGFHICTSWLVEALALIGRRAEAERLFKAMCDLAGPTGLLPEQFCPVSDRSLGNHPQAYSHLGLINAALRLDETGGN